MRPDHRAASGRGRGHRHTKHGSRSGHGLRWGPIIDQHSRRQRRPGDILRECAHCVDRRRERDHAIDGDAPVRRLEAHHPTEGRRSQHRPHGLRTQRQRHDSRRHRRRRAGAGASRRARLVVRVGRRTGLHERELCRHGLAEHQRPRLPQAPHRRRLRHRKGLNRQRAPGPHRQAIDGEDVLHAHQRAGQRRARRRISQRPVPPREPDRPVPLPGRTHAARAPAIRVAPAPHRHGWRGRAGRRAARPGSRRAAADAQAKPCAKTKGPAPPRAASRHPPGRPRCASRRPPADPLPTAFP